MPEFKARTVRLRRTNGQYILMRPRGEDVALIPPMCTDWESVTGLKLEEGQEVNIKLHVELKSKVRQVNAPVPVPEDVREAPRNFGIDERPWEGRGPTTQFVRRQPIPNDVNRVAQIYQEAMTRMRPRYFEVLTQRIHHQIEASLREDMELQARERPEFRHERYQELRHRDPGAGSFPWRTDIP